LGGFTDKIQEPSCLLPLPTTKQCSTAVVDLENKRHERVWGQVLGMRLQEQLALNLCLRDDLTFENYYAARNKTSVKFLQKMVCIITVSLI
jgi:hypothetical protein